MRIRLFPPLVTALALFAGACTRQPVQPQFGELTADTLVGQKPAACQVSYRFATILNTAQSPALEAIEQANIGYFFELEEFSGTAQQALAEALRQLSTDLASADSPLIPNAIPGWEAGEISAEAEGMVVDTLLSYVISRSSFMGGAHGIYGTDCHTYSLRSGDELSLQDLLAPERVGRLKQAVRSKLYEKYEAKDDEALAAMGFFPEYIDVSENFQVGPEGLTFHYNPYEIGCYALGAVEVSFSNEELAQL